MILAVKPWLYKGLTAFLVAKSGKASNLQSQRKNEQTAHLRCLLIFGVKVVFSLVRLLLIFFENIFSCPKIVTTKLKLYDII